VGGDSVGSAVIGGMEAKIHPLRQNREAGEPERANDKPRPQKYGPHT